MKSRHLFAGSRRVRGVFVVMTTALTMVSPMVAKAWTHDSQSLTFSSNKTWAAPLAVSSNGESFQAVNFYGSTTIGSLTVTAPGPNDWRWALVKFSRSGEPIWGTVIIEGSGDINAVAVDTAGNSYVSGGITGTVTIGSVSLTSTGQSDAFVAKLNPSGSVVWAVKFGGTSSDWAVGVDVDASGNVFFGGGFRGSATFAGSTITSAGNNDLWIAKLNSSGVAQWVNRFGGTGDENGGWNSGVAVDGSGNAYLAGQINSSFIVNGTTYNSSGNLDSVVAKIDTSGNWLWLATGGSAAQDHVYGLDVDASGNAYVTGQFSGDATWGSVTLTNSGDTDAYVAKVSSSGTWQWARKIGSTNYDYGYAISVSSTGRVVATGEFSSPSIDVSGTILTKSGSSADGWVTQFDSSGTLQWAHRFGGADYDGGFGAGFDGDGNSYISGESDGSGQVVFGAGSSIGHLTGCTSSCYSSVLWALSPSGGVVTTTTTTTTSSSTTSTTSTTTPSTSSTAAPTGPTTTVKSTSGSSSSPSTTAGSRTDTGGTGSGETQNETPTTTTTTIAKRTAPSVEEVELGEATARIGGEKVSSTLTRESNRITISIQDVLASIGGVNRDGTPVALDADGNLRVKPGETISVRISGIAPDSRVSAWMFSDPIDLGTADATSVGEAEGTFVVPMSVEEGNHTLVVEMTSADGDAMQASLGMAVGALDNNGFSVAVPLTLLAVAVLVAVVLPVTMRRRRTHIAK